MYEGRMFMEEDNDAMKIKKLEKKKFMKTVEIYQKSKFRDHLKAMKDLQFFFERHQNCDQFLKNGDQPK